jgi:hypothetical protein
MSFNVAKTINFLLEGSLEIFSPNHDNYPAIGIQPFTGEICHREKGGDSNS